MDRWPYLIRYLEDGRLELSDNRVELSIKSFVMGQKIGYLQIPRLGLSLARRLID